MKAKLIVIVSIPILVICAVVAQPILKHGEWVVINTSAASPVQLTNTALKCNSITLFGKKDFQTTNTTAVYVGFTTTNGKQGVSIDPGASVVIKDSTGLRMIQASNVFLDVITANDGVVVYYD